MLHLGKIRFYLSLSPARNSSHATLLIFSFFVDLCFRFSYVMVLICLLVCFRTFIGDCFKLPVMFAVSMFGLIIYLHVEKGFVFVSLFIIYQCFFFNVAIRKRILINSLSCCLTHGETKEAVFTFNPCNPVLFFGKGTEN